MFHIFVGSTYYPSSGLGDYCGCQPTQAEAMQIVANTRGDWWCIATTNTTGQLVMVAEGDRDADWRD